MFGAGPLTDAYLGQPADPGSDLMSPAPPVVAPSHLQAPPPPAAPPLPAPATTPSAAPGLRTRAGLALIGAAAATAVGAWLGGGYGAGAGLLLYGGGRNALRARAAWIGTPPDPAGGTRAATLALFGLGVGGYLGYRAFTRNTTDG